MQRLQVKFKSIDREILDPDITNKADRRDSRQVLKKQVFLRKCLAARHVKLKVSYLLHTAYCYGIASP